MLKLQRTVVSAAAAGALGCASFGMHAVAAGPQSDAAAKPETVESRTITVRVDRPFTNVYEFLADPANWNQWAFGLGKNIRRSKDGWIADSDGGIARVRFTPRNNSGVVDHTVTRPSGQLVYVPMRLIVNGTGCELLFTLFREPKMSDAQFASDAGFVQRDLNGLKMLLENERAIPSSERSFGPVLVNTCVVTENVKRLVGFYEPILGQKARWSGDDYAEFATGAGVLAIFSTSAQEKYIPGSAESAKNRSVILEFKVTDVDAEYLRLKDMVKTWVKPPTTQPWGTRSMYLRDPDGNLVDFYSPAPAS